jgi:type I restriction enzyme M protein
MTECFTIYADEVENRIDSHFYRPEFIQFYQQLEKTKFEIKTIGEIAEKVTSGATPLSKGDAYTSKYEGIPFIRSGDINEDKQINFYEVVYIKEDIHNKLLKGSKLKKGDVLIAIVGATIGQVSIYDYDKEANINQAIALVRLKQEINPEYVKAFMISKLGQKQLDRIKRPVARANINLDEIRSLKIILPSLEIQNKVISLMQTAYEEQKNKEKKINEFLDSINDYVLDELGIRLPELKHKMVYVVNSDEVQNKRADAYYYQPKFEEVEKAIKKGKFQVKDLQQITELLINGFDFRDFVDDGVMYLRVSNVKPNRLDLSDVMFVPNMDITKDIKLKEGDVLLTRKGTYGVATVADKESEKYLISSEIFRIVLKEGLNPFYLSSWLNSGCQQIIFNRIKTGGIMGHLSQEALLQIEIPLPPLYVQNKIAEEVKQRMRKAEQLQKEAKDELEKAKQQVEKIILADE